MRHKTERYTCSLFTSQYQTDRVISTENLWDNIRKTNNNANNILMILKPDWTDNKARAGTQENEEKRNNLLG